MSALLDAAKTLPLPERIELAEALWEDITREGYEPELTPGQTAELDRRLAAHQNDPDNVISWESMKAELQAKFGKGR